MAGPVIAVTDSVFPSLDPAKAALARLDPTYRMAKSVNPDDIVAVAKDADAVLVTYAKLTREVLTQLTRCKAIGRFGLGVDNIDLVTAKEKGIAVNYVPDYCIREVSDHAMALLLALIRKIPLSNKLVQSGRWEMPAVVPIRRIEGTVLGLIGFGHIPRLVAPKAQAFGIKVIAFDPFRQAGRVQGRRRRKRRLRHASSEIRLRVGTRAIDARNARHDERIRLRENEKGCLHRQHGARTTDRRARARLRHSTPVRLAAPDSTSLPPSRLPRIHRLLGRDNVIISPHTAFYSIEALNELQTKCASDVARVLSGEKAVYPISA